MIKEDILDSFNGKRVLVTGGTGLIGRQMVDMISNAAADVTVASLDQININDWAKQSGIISKRKRMINKFDY
jgi:GDP-L-fucose synthase